MKPARLPVAARARQQAPRAVPTIVLVILLVTVLAAAAAGCGGNAEAGVVTVVMEGLDFHPQRDHHLPRNQGALDQQRRNRPYLDSPGLARGRREPDPLEFDAHESR